MVHDAFKYCFLSRPRWFGKSLLTSTLHSYFAEKKDLFKGLAIEKLETEWTEYLVLRFIPNKSEELSSKQRGGLRAGWMFMLGVEEIKGKRIYLLFVSDFFVIFTKSYL